jgi:endonuclease G, mitochondrial
MIALARRCLLPLLALLTLTPLLVPQEAMNRNVRFGMPTPATTDPSHREDYLIARSQYVLSYNGKTHAPNWVSWCLRKEDIGKSTRGPFEPDPLLPKSFAHVTSHLYDDCGFDRGHMCPAQDRSSHQSDMNATFYMTNVVPQSPHSNQRAWERLESYCRTLAKDHVLYICCGPHGVGGTGKSGSRTEIGRGSLLVAVPAKIWKVILVLPSADAEPRKNTRAIAVIMPNDQSVDYQWPKYRVSVREVERLTGYTFFRNMHPEVSAAIKSDVDDVGVKVPKSKYGAN